MLLRGSTSCCSSLCLIISVTECRLVLVLTLRFSVLTWSAGCHGDPAGCGVRCGESPAERRRERRHDWADPPEEEPSEMLVKAERTDLRTVYCQTDVALQQAEHAPLWQLSGRVELVPGLLDLLRRDLPSAPPLVVKVQPATVQLLQLELRNQSGQRWTKI